MSDMERLDYLWRNVEHQRAEFDRLAGRLSIVAVVGSQNPCARGSRAIRATRRPAPEAQRMAISARYNSLVRAETAWRDGIHDWGTPPKRADAEDA